MLHRLHEGKIFAPIIDDNKYCLVHQVVNKLDHKNLDFYSVDIATKRNGNDIVIEIGDGQVSDYVGWSLQNFIKVLCYLAQ